MSTVTWISALPLCFAIACGGRSALPTTTAAIDPLDLYPMHEGNAWSYDVDTGEPTTTLAITRVEAFDGRVAEVRAATAVVRYEVRPEGIYVPVDDAWLVRAPLRVGATWPGRGGRTAELVSMHATAETPAGKFDACVEVVEVGGKLELEVRTVYCPGVGPVAVASTMRSTVSERVLTVSALLRGFTVSAQTPSHR